MRALLFLVLAFLLVVGVLRFYPQAPVEAAEEGAGAQAPASTAENALDARPAGAPLAAETVGGAEAEDADLPGGAVRFVPRPEPRPEASAPAAARAATLTAPLAAPLEATGAPAEDAPGATGPAATAPGADPVPPGAPSPSLGAAADAPEALLARLELEAREHADAGRAAEAARAWGELLQRGLALGVERARLATWSAGLAAAQDRHRWSPRGEWPHEEVVVEPGDSLTAIRKRYLERHPERLLCTGLVEHANRIRGYIQPGQRLRIPTDPVRVLVDLSSRWLLYFHGNEVVLAYEVGVGRAGEETLTGTFTAGEKQERPTWWPLGKDPIPFGDPENPLGTRWIGWYRDGAKTGYGFHGTWEPESIGEAASDGCIRLRNEDVELLFDVLPVGAPVEVRE